MKKEIIYISLAVAFALTGCKSHKDTVTTADFHSYTTECLGKNMDGTQTLRVWAEGNNRADAIEQARKKAVYDVTFVGIQAGGGECNAYPVVDEANARTKYEEYFDRFFADGGEYTKYVSKEIENKKSVQKFQGTGRQTFGVVVTVDRSALRKRYTDDNIILK